MMCFTELVAKLYAIGVVATDGPPPLYAETGGRCATLCYYTTSCSSFLFNKHTKECQLRTRLITISHFAPGNANYFIFYPETCQVDGYQFIRRTKMCVSFSMDLKSWDNSKSACESDGGRLIKIDTEEKMKDIKDIIAADYSEVGFYIGGSDIRQGGVWEWTDGTIVEQFWWNPDEPTNLSDENCLEINNVHPDWDDATCNLNLRYICEKL